MCSLIWATDSRLDGSRTNILRIRCSQSGSGGGGRGQGGRECLILGLNNGAPNKSERLSQAPLHRPRNADLAIKGGLNVRRILHLGLTLTLRVRLAAALMRAPPTSTLLPPANGLMSLTSGAAGFLTGLPYPTQPPTPGHVTLARLPFLQLPLVGKRLARPPCCPSPKNNKHAVDAGASSGPPITKTSKTPHAKSRFFFFSSRNYQEPQNRASQPILSTFASASCAYGNGHRGGDGEHAAPGRHATPP